MYKTVRHGENSLQYTILPQTEEVLSNSGLKGKGRDYSPSIHVRRSRRKSTVKYLLLIVLGMIMAFAIAFVPLYGILTGDFYVRLNHEDNHEVITLAPLSFTGREMVKLKVKELKVAPVMTTTTVPKLDTSVTTGSSTTSTSTTTPSLVERTATPPWSMPALKSWKRILSVTTIPPLPTEDDEISQTSTTSTNIQHHDVPKEDTIIRPTVTPEPINIRKVFRLSKTPPETEAKDKVFEDVLITTKAPTIRTTASEAPSSTSSDQSKFKELKDTILSVDDDDEFKESLEVDEVFPLPPLKPESSSESDSDEVTVSKAKEGWYGARWPFVDTSSYFQWTGYSSGDNLLLPLLVAALSSIALVLLLALAVRRRKRSHTVSAQIGKLTADLQEDDNTNLLTAENPEEGEE